MSNEDEYKTVAIVAAALLAPKLADHGKPTDDKRAELMQQAIGDARALLRLSKELIAM